MYFNTNINLIRVPRVFSGSHPNEDKMNACRAYYRENHKIDRDIVVDENMQLKDGYIGYLVLIHRISGFERKQRVCNWSQTDGIR